MKDAGGSRRKLIIFTEHRDTLDYLVERIGTFLGRPTRSSRSTAGCPATSAAPPSPRSRTTRVVVLVATDAAGRGSTSSAPT